jgi:hypothetical protein
MSKPDTNDLFGVAGFGLVAAGLWMIYEPAALIVVGGALIALHLRGAGLRRRGG